MGFLIGLAGFALMVYAVVQGALYGGRGEYAQADFWLLWACLMMLTMVLASVGVGRQEKK